MNKRAWAREMDVRAASSERSGRGRALAVRRETDAQILKEMVFAVVLLACAMAVAWTRHA